MIKNLLSKEDYIKLSTCDIAAITGPMAAGKNYICSLFEKDSFGLKGFVSIDADVVVHDAIKEATAEILSAFSEKAEEKGIVIQNPDGSLNRRELGKLLFSDKDLLAQQENIVYPYVNKIIDNFIKDNLDKKVLINATVLYKTTALLNRCQVIIYVTAPFFTRLKRAHKRDGLSYRQIINRFRNQRNLLSKYKDTGKEIIIINNK